MPIGAKVRVFAAAAAVSLSGLSIAAVAAAPAGAATTRSVAIVGLSFSPKTLTVQPGDTVVWTNNSGFMHTVTADDGSFDSGSLSPGQSFSHTFPDAATVPYHCSFHGAAGGRGMAGTVVVQVAAPPTSGPRVTTPPATTPATAPAGIGVPPAPAPAPTTAPPSGPAPAPSAPVAGVTASTDPTQLPHTGANSAEPALLAIVLLASGAAAVVGARRRRA